MTADDERDHRSAGFQLNEREGKGEPVAVIAAKPQAEKGRDRPPPQSSNHITEWKSSPTDSQLVLCESNRLVPGWVMTGGYYFFFINHGFD